MASPRTQLLHLPRILFSSSATPQAAVYKSASIINPLSRQLLSHCRYASTASSSSSPFATPTPSPEALERFKTVPKTPQPAPLNYGACKYGKVISAGRMTKTVRVQVVEQERDKWLRRSFPKKTTFLVSDPRESLREGDTIEFVSGWRAGRRVRHVVERIVAPFGSGVDERPPVMSREERAEDRAMKDGLVQIGKIKKKVLQRLAVEKERMEEKEALMDAKRQEGEIKLKREKLKQEEEAYKEEERRIIEKATKNWKKG